LYPFEKGQGRDTRLVYKKRDGYKGSTKKKDTINKKIQRRTIISYILLFRAFFFPFLKRHKLCVVALPPNISFEKIHFVSWPSL